MMGFKRFLLYILFALAAVPGFAEGVSVRASLDSTEIQVGDQIKLSVELRMDKGLKVEPVTRFDSLTAGVELVEVKKADTAVIGGSLVVKQDFMITSFDSGYYEISPLKYKANDKIYYSMPLKFSVYNVENIDIEKDEIKDIKGIYYPPFDWFGLIGVLVFVHLFLVVASVLLWLFFSRRKRRDGAEDCAEEEEEDDRTIDQIAMEKLNKMKAERIWLQPDKEKVFYTQLTDILREYLGLRFNVRAKEMTSYEIIDALKYELDMSPVMADFKEICQMSDMVKFAKQKPSGEECEMSLVKSFFIVTQTVKKAEPKEAKETKRAKTEDSSDYMPKSE